MLLKAVSIFREKLTKLNKEWKDALLVFCSHKFNKGRNNQKGVTQFGKTFESWEGEGVK